MAILGQVANATLAAVTTEFLPGLVEIPFSTEELVIVTARTTKELGDNTQEVLWCILGLTTMMWASYVVGWAVEKIGGPALVGEIFVGMAFGPDGFPLLSDYMRKVGGPLDIIGTTGLLLLVYEGGLTTDLGMFKTHGIQVLSLAFTGIIMPVVFAIPVMMAFGFPLLEAVASGTVLCSTAIAFTVRLLSDNNLLKTHKGQLIIISAVIDDICSLVVLAVLNVLGGTKFDAWTVLRPLVWSAAIFLIAVVWKFTIAYLVNECGDNWVDKNTTGSRVPYFNTIVTIFVLMATYGSQRCGSTYLLGTYMMGIVVSAIPTAEDIWEESVGPAIRPWFGRLFFVATVGFAIPLDALVHPSSLACGAVLTLAAIAGKFLTGIFSGNPRSKGYCLLFVQVGCAMVGRGELGFVVAKMALNMGLLTEISFSACIWALLLATILGPFMFQFTLRWDDPPNANVPADTEANGTYQTINAHDVRLDEHGSREKKKVFTSHDPLLASQTS